MNRFQIKVVMVICFILGTIGMFIPNVPFYLNYPGRVVMPVAIFLTVDGYYKTSSFKNYLKRMLLFGEGMLCLNVIISLIMRVTINGEVHFEKIKEGIVIYGLILILVSLIFFVLNFKGKCLSDRWGIIIVFILSLGMMLLLGKIDNSIDLLRSNMFLALAGVLLLVNALERSKKELDKKALIRVLIIFSVCILTETAIIGPAFALIVYVFRKNKRMLITGLFVISGLFIPGFSLSELLKFPQWMMFFGIIFILLYNEEEGIKIKKIFYYIYPVVIYICFILGILLR
ncbi:MAG: TraX family protein [Clostridium sp.]|uniref:TraX family protein n=1 Tax=Clostridium sp. TaxID=1506 RepID=UPI003F2FA5E0